MARKATLFVTAATAAMLAGTAFANAQILRDDPPGSLFQDRGIVQSNGQTFEEAYEPWNQYYGGEGAYAYAYAYRPEVAMPRHVYRGVFHE